MRQQGHPAASLDVLYGKPRKGKMDAMDMTSSAGMAFLDLPSLVKSSHCFSTLLWGFWVLGSNPRLAIATMMNMAINCVVVCGIVCKSFVCVSSGTHQRTPWRPLGRQDVQMVQQGNIFMSRTSISNISVFCGRISTIYFST